MSLLGREIVCFICLLAICISFINGLCRFFKNWLIFFVFILEVLFMYIDISLLSRR